MKIIKFCLEKSLVLNLLTLLVILLGIYSVMTLRREAFPVVAFDQVFISTPYPGASPKEVELYLTNPIEEKLKEVSGIEEAKSMSSEGRSLIILKLNADDTEKQKSKTVQEIRSAVDQVNDLPDNLPESPTVKEADSRDFPVVEIAISGNRPYAEIHEIADNLTKQIERLNDVSSIVKRGFRDKEYWVEVDPEKASRYNIGFAEVMDALQNRNLNLPGGSIKSDHGEFLIRTIGQTNSPKEIENIVLRSNDSGVVLRLGEIAKVISTFEEEKLIMKSKGHTAIDLLVRKAPNGDIIQLVDQVKAIADEFIDRETNVGVSLNYVNDMSVFVRNRLGILANNGFMGIVLVLIILLMFLSKEIAFVAAIGMPTAFLGAIWLMSFADITINLISMFALVIVLGMLVDDAIIVAENIYAHYERGKTPYQATIDGASEVFWPITATVLTTIAAFSPLLMVTGIFGKFISQMPKVVVAALGMSLLEALFVLPGHTYDAIRFIERRSKKKPKKVKKERKPKDDKILRFYEKSLRAALKSRYIIFATFAAVLIFSLHFALTKMPVIMFPADGVEVFQIRAKLPIETPLEEYAEKIEVLEKVVDGIPGEEIDTYITMSGIQQKDTTDPFTQRGSHLGQINVYLTPEKNRNRTAEEIINSIKEEIFQTGSQHGFSDISFERVEQGPPVGKPVAIKIKGENLDNLDSIAKGIQDKLREIEGVIDISQNFLPGKDEILISIDEKKSKQSLLTVKQVATHIRASFEGIVASYSRVGNERIGIRVRYPESIRKKISSLNNLKITNRFGNQIPLSSIATLEKGPGITGIAHNKYRRAITVTSDVDESITTSELVNKAMFPYLKEIESKNPNVVITAGGEWEDTQKSYESLARSFLVALLLIFFILATQFSSISQPFVIMTAIPFGIIGVIWSFYIHGVPLSFLGLVGAIGLTGVVVNDSIVLVDFINNAIKNGQEPFEAALHAGKRRFRAVWLTTLTTAFGVLPLIYGWGGTDKLLRPAAIALGYGLVFGTLIVLIFIPAVYLIRIDVKKMLGFTETTEHS